jgi:hypothetical protein
MHRLVKQVFLAISLAAATATAQTNTFPASGNVGIGTTNPNAALDLATSLPKIMLEAPTGGNPAVIYNDGNFNINAGAGPLWIRGASNILMNTEAGFVGIGTTSPSALLDVNGTSNFGNNNVKIGYAGIPTIQGLNAGEPLFLSNGGDGGNNSFFPFLYQNYQALNVGFVNYGGSPYGGVNGTAFNTALQVTGSGAVYTGAPQQTTISASNNPGIVVRNVLDNGGGNASFAGNVGVNGNINLATGSGAHMTYADGTVQSTAWTGVLSGGDYAESVDVAGERLDYLPGEVSMIDPEHPDHFRKASEPYSHMVAGIYSTKPGVTGRRQPTVKPPDEIPMAMIGIVPAKVSTENGPVLPGDLLVASSTPGYAMKGTDKDKLTGAIIGKAMGHLEHGQGLIEVLVTLQ